MALKQIIAVASGKGGVGKSTVAANLACSFARRQLGSVGGPGKVALIDVDFYGPSVPTLMGGGELAVVENKFVPVQKFGVKFISIAFFLKNPDDPVIWRGPMFGKAMNQLFNDAAWGDVDIAIVDMPPGTGDAQLSLSQLVNLDGAVLVTTPQEVSLSDVRRAVRMFGEVKVPVLGIVENMAAMELPDGSKLELFGSGGGEELAKNYNCKFFGSLPLDIDLRTSGDKGVPIASNSDNAYAKRFDALAEQIVEELGKNQQPEVEIVN